MNNKFKVGDIVYFNPYALPTHLSNDRLVVFEVYYDNNPKYYREDTEHLYKVIKIEESAYPQLPTSKKLDNWISESNLITLTELKIKRRNNKIDSILNQYES